MAPMYNSIRLYLPFTIFNNIIYLHNLQIKFYVKLTSELLYSLIDVYNNLTLSYFVPNL